MQRTNGVVNPINTTLGIAPKGFGCVDVCKAPHVLLGCVLNNLVSVSERRNGAVTSQFVSIDGGGTRRADMIHNHRKQCRTLDIRHNLSDCVPFTLYHAHNNRLASSTPATLPRPLSADVGFI